MAQNMKERKAQPIILGSQGVVEDLVQQGRIPTFSEPTIVNVNGMPKRRVLCTVPGVDGEEPMVISLFPGNATQVKRRIKHAF